MDAHIVTTDRLQGLPKPVQGSMDFTGMVSKPWIRSVRVSVETSYPGPSDVA